MLRRIFDSQPTASRANLELLFRTVAEVQLNAEAMQASIEEVKKNWSVP